jgi:hypothetical protein
MLSWGQSATPTDSLGFIVRLKRLQQSQQAIVRSPNQLLGFSATPQESGMCFELRRTFRSLPSQAYDYQQQSMTTSEG